MCQTPFTGHDLIFTSTYSLLRWRTHPYTHLKYNLKWNLCTVFACRSWCYLSIWILLARAAQSFSGASYRDVCLLLNIMQLDYTCLVVLKAPIKYILKTQQLFLFPELKTWLLKIIQRLYHELFHVGFFFFLFFSDISQCRSKHICSGREAERARCKH